MQATKLVRRVFQVLALLIFTYQMIEALRKYFNFSSIPSAETKDISEAKLPSIFLCLQDVGQRNFEAYRKNGYKSYNDFLFGSVNGSSDIVSWEGTKNISYEDVVRQIFYSMTTDDYDAWMINGKILTLPEHFTIFSGFCHELDIDIAASSEILVSTLQGQEFQIIVTDPEMSLYYAIYSDTHKGEKIETMRDSSVHFSLALEEIHWMEDNGECANYGEGKEFTTYAECVAEEHAKIFRPHLGCLVPWLSAPNHTDQCKGRIPITEDNYNNLTDIIKELDQRVFSYKEELLEDHKVCLKPCTEIVVNSEMRSKVWPVMSTIGLKFKRIVKVTRYMMAYGIFDLVVEIGSSLGLWIGLSALGIFDLLLEAKKFI